MKFIAAILLTALLSFITGLYLPWWGIALAAFLAALVVPQRAAFSFISGLLGVMLLWCGLAWWIDIKNQGILSSRIANVLPLGGNVLLLILVTGLIGGLVAGFAAMSGSYLRFNRPVKIP
jgi:hypothetical protein